MAFEKATKCRQKLRAALFGPSGAGKTYTALSMAKGMVKGTGGKIALIDSERGSASKYADRFDFDTQDLDKKTVEECINFINEAESAGYAVLIIDSLSHCWETLCEEVQKIADARYRGNYWAAWSEGTPLQKKLIDVLTSYPGHIIATMRSKTEWQTGGGEASKSKPVRVGLAPEQGKGIEYEFDILFEINPDHLATIIKDRTGKFQDRILTKPGVEFGEELVGWLNDGVVPLKEQIQAVLGEIGSIIKSISEKDGPYYNRFFSEKEYKDIREMCKESANMMSQDARLEYLQGVLANYQKILQDRMAQQAGTKTGQAVSSPPAAPAPKNGGKTDKPSLSDEYKKCLPKSMAEMR